MLINLHELCFLSQKRLKCHILLKSHIFKYSGNKINLLERNLQHINVCATDDIGICIYESFGDDFITRNRG